MIKVFLQVLEQIGEQDNDFELKKKKKAHKEGGEPPEKETFHALKENGGLW